MIDSNELEQLRAEVRQLRAQLTRVEDRLYALARPVSAPVEPAPPPPAPQSTMSAPVELPPPLAVPPVIATTIQAPPRIPAPPPVPAASAAPAAEAESFEVRFGTYWLPRIGITALLLGMMFLITYSYQYLGRGGKVALSYLCCAALGGLGIWLERKTEALARVLQAGALALLYFVTYAAHFVEPFRVIESAPLALVLLVAVVAGIVAVADGRRSPTMAGMALFLGYFTSVMSGVTSFTLAANALLAVAALILLARHQWTPLTFGAVLATYFAYLLWVGMLNNWADLGRLVWHADYLSVEDFRLRGGFLALYWALFTVGGLLIRPGREGDSTAERNGLLTLNNLFFFVLFTLLVHHTASGNQWQFHLVFALALAAAAAAAAWRFAPDNGPRDLLLMQALLVGSLGIIGYFEGATLVAALALESVLLLVLARALNARPVAWIGRLVFAFAAWAAWETTVAWDRPLIFSVYFAAAMGYLGARFESRPGTPGTSSITAVYFAFVATVLLLRAGGEQFGRDALPWVWTLGTVVVALVGLALRTREIRWLALFPWLLGVGGFLVRHVLDRPWTLASSLALSAVTFGAGLLWWAWRRAHDEPAAGMIASNRALRPFAIVGVIVIVLTTLNHVPAAWRLTAFAAETLIFVSAALLARETLFIGLALATMGSGTAWLLAWEPASDLTTGTLWLNLALGLGLFFAAERLFKAREALLLFYAGTRQRLRLWMVVLLAVSLTLGVHNVVAGGLLTVSWAVGGFGLMVIGFAGRERAYRLAGLALLAICLLRAVFYDLGQLETIYRILSFIGLGVICLVLAFVYARHRERIAKWL